MGWFRHLCPTHVSSRPMIWIETRKEKRRGGKGMQVGEREGVRGKKAMEGVEKEGEESGGGHSKA